MDKFPGIEALIDKNVSNPIDAVDLLLKGLLKQAETLEDPLKKRFLDVLCNTALESEVLEHKLKGYVCAAGGFKDDGKLQDFMRYTIELLEQDIVHPETQKN